MYDARAREGCGGAPERGARPPHGALSSTLLPLCVGAYLAVVAGAVLMNGNGPKKPSPPKRVRITPALAVSARRYGLAGFLDTLATLAGKNPDDLILSTNTSDDPSKFSASIVTSPSNNRNTIHATVPYSPNAQLQAESRGMLAHEYGHLFQSHEPILQAFLKAYAGPGTPEAASQENDEAFADLFTQALGRIVPDVSLGKHIYRTSAQYDTPSTRRFLDSLVTARLQPLRSP